MKHIRREEHDGLWYWAVYHCLYCSCGTRCIWQSAEQKPALLFLVPHFKLLKEYVRK